jgi:hypothetical protein
MFVCMVEVHSLKFSEHFNYRHQTYCNLKVMSQFASRIRYWSNKTLIEHNHFLDYVRLILISTSSMYKKMTYKRPILQLSNKIQIIVEQNIVEHPNSRRFDLFSFQNQQL